MFKRIGPLAAPHHHLLYLNFIYLSIIMKTHKKLPCSYSLLKITWHYLLLLVGFNNLTYRKGYDRSPTLVGHHMGPWSVARWCCLSNLVPQFLSLVRCPTWSRHLCISSCFAMLCLLGSDGLWDYVQFVMSNIFGLPLYFCSWVFLHFVAFVALAK